MKKVVLITLIFLFVVLGCNKNITGPQILTSVSISPTNASVGVGGNLQFTGIAKDQGGNQMSATFVWTSSNNAVATIDSNGLLIAVSAGIVTVTVTAGGSVTNSTSVTVTASAPVLSSIVISPLTPTVTVGGTLNFIGSPKDQYGNAFAASVSWTSSNGSIGGINSSGIFTAIAAGNTTVTGTAGTFSASTVVSVQPSLRYMYLRITGDGPAGTSSSFGLTVWVTTSSTSSTLFGGPAVIDASNSFVWRSIDSDGYVYSGATFHWSMPIAPGNQGVYVEVHKIINGVDTIYASAHDPAGQTGNGGSLTF